MPSLAAATSAPYNVRFEQVAVAGGANLHICALSDRQQFDDPHGEAAAAGVPAASWPHFGQIWPSSRKLADLMQTWTLAGRRILEVGCGLGLASLVMHRRQGNVVATDHHPLAAAFLRSNSRLNALAALDFRAADWRNLNPQLGCFDLIVGSDVLYERDHPDQLAGFIDRHSTTHAEVLIIDPNRGNRAAFRRCMNGHGFGLTETALVTPLEDGSAYRGRLLQYQR